MAKKIDNSLLLKIGQQKAFDFYGIDGNFDDGRTKKHHSSRVFIDSVFPVKEVIDEHFNPPYLYYTVTLITGHLIKFKIDENGYWQQFTVPVFGGLNTPYFLPISKQRKPQQTQISWKKRKVIRKVTLKALKKIIIHRCSQILVKSVV